MFRQKYKKICDYMVKHPWIMVAGFFLVNFILRGILSSYSRAIRIYNDELYYYGIARSLFQGNGITVRGVPVAFQKILYSLILAPTFAIDSSVIQMKVIAWINSLLISLSVFPAYGIAKRLMKKSTYIVCALLFWITMSNMVVPATFMCESLFMPLALTFVYLVLVIYQTENTAQQFIRNVVLGILLYILFQAESASMYLGVAYVGVSLWKLCFASKSTTVATRRIGRARKWNILLQLLCMAAAFLICYLMFKYFLYEGSGNSYVSAITGSHHLFERIKNAVLYYPYNLVYLILAFGIFPVLLPLGEWKQLSGKNKYLLLFLYMCLLVECAEVSYIITAVEDSGAFAVRQHIRYIEPLIYVFATAFFAVLENEREGRYEQKFDNERKDKHEQEDKNAEKNNALLLIFTVYLALFVAIGVNFDGGGSADNTSLEFYQFLSQELADATVDFGQGTLVPLLLRMTIAAAVAIGVLFYIKKRRSFVICAAVSLLAVNCLNYVFSYTTIRKIYYVKEEKVERFDETDRLLEKLTGNIIVITNVKNEPIQPALDSYIDSKVSIVTLRELYDSKIIEDGVIDLKSEVIPAVRPENGYYQNLKSVDYILVGGDVSIEQVRQIYGIPIEQDGYILYENLTPENVHVSCTYEEVMTEEEKQQMMVFVAD